MIRYRVTFAAALGLSALALTGCSGPSLTSVADECGGEAAGIAVDETGLVVDAGSDALICVLPKIFDDHADQYAVTLSVDNGNTGTLELDGRTVKFVELAGSPVVFFSAK